MEERTRASPNARMTSLRSVARSEIMVSGAVALTSFGSLITENVLLSDGLIRRFSNNGTKVDLLLAGGDLLIAAYAAARTTHHVQNPAPLPLRKKTKPIEYLVQKYKVFSKVMDDAGAELSRNRSIKPGYLLTGAKWAGIMIGTLAIPDFALLGQWHFSDIPKTTEWFFLRFGRDLSLSYLLLDASYQYSKHILGWDRTERVLRMTW